MDLLLIQGGKEGGGEGEAEENKGDKVKINVIMERQIFELEDWEKEDLAVTFIIILLLLLSLLPPFFLRLATPLAFFSFPALPLFFCLFSLRTTLIFPLISMDSDLKHKGKGHNEIGRG